MKKESTPSVETVTVKERKYYKNPYINYFVRLFDQEQFRGQLASQVAKYAGEKWSAMNENDKKPYREMALQAPKRRTKRAKQLKRKALKMKMPRMKAKDVEEVRTRRQEDGIACETRITEIEEFQLPIQPENETSSSLKSSPSTSADSLTCVTEDTGRTSQTQDSLEGAMNEHTDQTSAVSRDRTRSIFSPGSSIEDSPGPSRYRSSSSHFSPINSTIACARTSDPQRKLLPKGKSVKRKLSVDSDTNSESFEPVAKRTRGHGLM